MKNKRPYKLTKGGLYIALCCCALIIAAIGYAGTDKQSKNEDLSEIQNIANSDISQSEIYFEDDILTVTDTEKETKVIMESDTKDITVIEDTSPEISVSKTVEVEEFSLKMPVEGSVISSFSGDELLYHETLSDWRTHNGIDIACDKDSAIYAAAAGVVTDIYDNALGKNVRIDHKNGYITVYANLSDQIELAIGDDVEEGTLIGKAGNASVGDFSTEPHLHFEVICNSKYVDPAEILIKD